MFGITPEDFKMRNNPKSELLLKIYKTLGMIKPGQDINKSQMAKIYQNSLTLKHGSIKAK